MITEVIGATATEEADTARVITTTEAIIKIITEITSTAKTARKQANLRK